MTPELYKKIVKDFIKITPGQINEKEIVKFIESNGATVFHEPAFNIIVANNHKTKFFYIKKYSA